MALRAKPEGHRRLSMNLWKRSFGKASLLLAAILAVGLQPISLAHAQTYTVLYTFTGGDDGANPLAGLTMDSSGNLYGTAVGSGSYGWGTVWELTGSGLGWSFSTLYAFQGLTGDFADGGGPASRAVFGPNGGLYGTTMHGGFGQGCIEWNFGCGTVYSLRNRSGSWVEGIFFQFGNFDGGNPGYGDVIFDTAGNLYDTSAISGPAGMGVAYQLHTINFGERVLRTFTGTPDGSNPFSGPILDSSGNLYGTATTGGANGYGAVYELSPSPSGWTEAVLYSFTNGGDGAGPTSNLVMDRSGNLYGATQSGGTYGGGTVFKLSKTSGSWTFATIYEFRAATKSAPGQVFSGGCAGQPFTGSNRTLSIDAAGTLYGTTSADTVNQYGSVFKLSPSGTTWTYTSLHNFSGADGGVPWGSLLLDTAGNLYGTAAIGGTNGCGLIFEITP